MIDGWRWRAWTTSQSLAATPAKLRGQARRPIVSLPTQRFAQTTTYARA
jgi:hypothetical protein